MTKNTLYVGSLVLLVLSGMLAAMYYRQLPGDRKVNWLDRMMSTLARTSAEDDARPDSAMWLAIERNLPKEVTDRPGKYMVHGLSQPIPIPLSTEARRSTLIQVCDSVPEWSKHYSPRMGFSVARSYQMFLGSLEPFPGDISTAQERDNISRMIAYVESLSSLEDPIAIDQSKEAMISTTRAKIDSEIESRRHKAEEKGYKATGPAEYLVKTWNRASNVQVQIGDKITERKNCIATYGGTTLDNWLQERNFALSAGMQPSIESLDLTGSLVVIDNQAESARDSSPTFQIRRLKLFQFERPDWFSPEPIAIYGRDGNFRSGALSGDPMKSLWGPDGAFNLLPIAIVVVDAPFSTFKLSPDDEGSLLEWIANPDKNRAIQDVKVTNFSDGTSRIAINDSKVNIRRIPGDHVPHIIAVVSIKLPATHTNLSR